MRHKALYSVALHRACPHQNQLPVCSCHGRNRTGTFRPSLVVSEFIKSAIVPIQPMNLSCCAPPGSTEATTVESLTSQASFPVTGLSVCQLSDTMPPRSYCAMISRRRRSMGTLSRFLSPPSSMRPKSKDIMAG